MLRPGDSLTIAHFRWHDSRARTGGWRRVLARSLGISGLARGRIGCLENVDPTQVARARLNRIVQVSWALGAKVILLVSSSGWGRPSWTRTLVVPAARPRITAVKENRRVSLERRPGRPRPTRSIYRACSSCTTRRATGLREQHAARARHVQDPQRRKARIPQRCAQAIVQRISTAGKSISSPGRSLRGIGTIIEAIVRNPNEA